MFLVRPRKGRSPQRITDHNSRNLSLRYLKACSPKVGEGGETKRRMGAVRRSRLYYSVGGGEREGRREIDREVMANWRGRNCRSTCEFSFHRCPCPPNSLSLSRSFFYGRCVGGDIGITAIGCRPPSIVLQAHGYRREGRPFAFLIADTDALFSRAVPNQSPKDSRVFVSSVI